MAWRILYHAADVQQAILDFPPGMQARYIHLTQRMIEFGPNLGMPHTRPLGRGLFELRMKAKEGIARVFFGVLAGDQIAMLHAFVKKSTKTPPKEIHIARARLKEAIANA